MSLSLFDRRILIFALAGCGLSVALGAFAAHGLASIVSERMLAVFHTGVRYQMWHSLGLIALLVLGLNISGICRKWLQRAKLSMCIGMLLFSGSLYLMVLTGVSKLGVITPIGGVLLIFGWVCAVIAIARRPVVDECTRKI